jgi:hypothetical protein
MGPKGGQISDERFELPDSWPKQLCSSRCRLLINQERERDSEAQRRKCRWERSDQIGTDAQEQRRRGIAKGY